MVNADAKVTTYHANDLIAWLLEGDVSIQFQVQRDLLKTNKPKQKQLQKRITTEGWGARFLALQNDNGHWGSGFYQQQWTSTHYTLLDLKHLGITQHHKHIQQTLALILQTLKGPDGGIYPVHTKQRSDVCINGMFLNYAAYFGVKEDDLKSIVDFLLTEHMLDGGFNCYSNTKGAKHSAMNSTLCVIEGILEYTRNGYQYKLEALQAAEMQSREFLLKHHLFRSDKTGLIIDKKMLMLSYPSRWKYDILRVLDYFHFAGVAYDARMADAIEVLLKKQRADHRWPLQAKHSGQTHFNMEKAGSPSRWNTLRALRVLQHFNINPIA